MGISLIVILLLFSRQGLCESRLCAPANRYINLSRLDAAVPKPIKPSEIAMKKERGLLLMRKVQKRIVAATGSATEAGTSDDGSAEYMSAARAAELADLNQQLAALKVEQERLDGQAVTFSVADMARTPLPKVLTPNILNFRYACEFGTKFDPADLREAGENVRQNAIEVRERECA